MLIKKYTNRRLYDTDASCYITLEDLAQRVKDGAEVRVVDAKSGADLTQPTLTQILMESRGGQALLPAPLLHQLIRLGDDALGEFFGRYVHLALEGYLQARRGTQSMLGYSPFAALNPFAGAQGMFGGWPTPQVAAPPPVPQAPSADVQSLRRELDELKKSLRKRRK